MEVSVKMFIQFRQFCSINYFWLSSSLECYAKCDRREGGEDERSGYDSPLLLSYFPKSPVARAQRGERLSVGVEARGLK